MRNGPPAPEVCSLAANFMAMLGATRSSVSAVITSTGGYFVPARTLWYGEYASRTLNWSGSSALPYSGIQKRPTVNR